MKLFVTLLMSVVFLAACDQDPLKNASDVVRNGRTPEMGKPIPEKPIDKNGLQIDSPATVNGRVGTPIEFVISGRVLLPGVNYSLSVDNLASFEGATFDPVTGQFSWTPGREAVGALPSVQHVLRVSLFTEATPENPVISIERKEISIVVLRSYTKPIINSVTGPDLLKVGSRHTLEVVLEDMDAQFPSDVSLVVRDCNNSYTNSVAHFVKKSGSIVADGTLTGKFNGRLSVDLSSGADNVRTGAYCFAISALSKYGVMSDAYEMRVSIDGKVFATKITNNEVYVNEGEVMRFAFSVYDPAADGVVTLKSMDDVGALLPGSSASCVRASATYILDCSMMVDARTATTGVYRVGMVVENRSRTRGATQAVDTKHTLLITVKAAQP